MRLTPFLSLCLVVSCALLTGCDKKSSGSWKAAYNGRTNELTVEITPDETVVAEGTYDADESDAKAEDVDEADEGAKDDGNDKDGSVDQGEDARDEGDEVAEGADGSEDAPDLAQAAAKENAVDGDDAVKAGSSEDRGTEGLGTDDLETIQVLVDESLAKVADHMGLRNARGEPDIPRIIETLIEYAKKNGGHLTLSAFLEDMSGGDANVPELPITLNVVVDYIQRNGKDLFRRPGGNGA